jgi:hypothetical protein
MLIHSGCPAPRFALVLALGLTLAAAPRVLAAPTIRADLHYEPSGVRYTAPDARALSREPSPRVEVTLEGAASRSFEGGSWPEPLVYLAVPEGMEPAGVTVSGERSVVLPGLEAVGRADVLPFLPVSDASPGSWFDAGWMRGTRLVAVRLTPLAWDAAAGTARLWTDIHIEMSLRPETVTAEPWRAERGGTPAAENFDRLIRSLVLNPDDVKAPGLATGRGQLVARNFSGGAWDSLFSPSLDGSPVEYVIITSDLLSGEYERLADWRTRSGTPAAIRTVEWIRSRYPEGVDLADSIRRFIRDAASLWGTEWVLLGGDTDVIPARIGRSLFSLQGEDIATDLYYQCLDRNWNQNGNDLFGEPADNADLLPEVWVSRIPLSTPEGVESVIDKTFQYERTPPIHSAYIPRLLALAEVLFPANWQLGQQANFDGGLLAEMVIDRLPASFQATRMYENYTASTWAPMALPEEKPAVLDSIDAGYQIVYHAGHGYRSNLSIGLGGGEILRDDAEAMSNALEPFLFYGINCNSASIDYDCIAETMLANPAGGCFAYIGSTRYDYPDAAIDYQNGFFEFTFEDGEPLARAHSLSKLAHIVDSQGDGPDRWHQMSFISLGDPIVRMRTASPRNLAVLHPAAVVAGGSVPVTVSLSGSPLSGARVTLYRAGDFFASDTTGADGTVNLPCAADGVGTVALTVTSLNAVPYEATLPLTAPAGVPYLRVAGLRIEDLPPGNGDGRLDPGETANLHFTIENVGGVTANAVTLAFASATDSLVVLAGTTDLGTLPPGGADSTFTSQVIQVRAEASLKAPLDAPGLLTITWTGGSRLDPVVLHVGGSSIWVKTQVVVDDPGGPGNDGIVVAGETVELWPRLVNRGLAVARSVRVRLVTEDHKVTIGTPQVLVGTLAPGGEADVPQPLTFSVTDLAAIPAIDLIIEANGVEQSRLAVDVTPPSTPGVAGGTSFPSSIRLTWPPVAASDLRGYAIFRSAALIGPYEQINQVADNPMGYYEDGPLDQFSRYYYRIAAQDQSGNLGPQSEAVSFVTSFPTLSNWPILRESATPSSPVVHDLNGDGTLEILFGGEEIYALHADGSEYRDGDNNTLTHGVLTQTGGANFWCTPAVADIDNDGILEIVAAGWNSGLLYVFGPDGSMKPGWPRVIGNPSGQDGAAVAWGSPLVIDVNGDGAREIFIPGASFLYGFRADGTEIIDGDSNPATLGRFASLGGTYNYGTPSGADFDHDGFNDVVVGTRNGMIHLLSGSGAPFPGFPKSLGGAITSSPAIADLDQDGELEMIFGVHDPMSQIQAINRFGASPPGWPVAAKMNQDLNASPTVADLNGDDFPDVAVTSGNGSVRIYRGQDGGLFPGFPVDLGVLARGTPCLGDVTGDGVPDLLIGTQEQTLYGISTAGAILPGFPLRTNHAIEGGALLWDVDNDGFTNLVFSSIDRYVYAYDTPGIFSPDACPWPMFRHDQANTGYAGSPLSTPAAPVLASFTLEASGGGVRLAWEAAEAWSGWHVWRAEAASGAGERLTATLLPGGPGRKSWVDATAVPGGRYRYWLTAIDRTGETVTFPPVAFNVPLEAAPRVTLLQNSPNPFRDGTVIQFTLPGVPADAADPVAASVAAGEVTARLAIFDAQGRQVQVLLEASLPPGLHLVSWDGRDAEGAAVRAGVYFYRLEAGDRIETRKLTVIR